MTIVCEKKTLLPEISVDQSKLDVAICEFSNENLRPISIWHLELKYAMIKMVISFNKTINKAF